MSHPVLVGYATRYGSTREVAEAIATVLRERGLEVDVKLVRGVATLDSYRAVILGAPLYIGRWHKDATRFAARHAGALASRPLAIFGLGPLAEGEMEGARAQFNAVLGGLPSLAPVDAELFGGRYNPDRLRFADRLLASLPASPLHGVPARDARDWEAIDAWARSLAPRLVADVT